MPFYTRVFSALPLTFARANPLMAEFDRIQAGFTAIESGPAAELTAARQGQGSLTLNLGRYLNTFSAWPGNVDAGGYRLTNVGAAVNNSDAVNLAQLQATAFATALPSQAGQAGMFIKSNGVSAYWSDLRNETPIKQARIGRCLAILNTIGA